MLIPKGFDKKYEFIRGGEKETAEYQYTEAGQPVYWLENACQEMNGPQLKYNLENGIYDRIIQVKNNE